MGVAETIGYIGASTIASGLAVGDSIDITVPSCGILMFDAGGGGSDYIFLKRYSAMQVIEQLESDNFKISVTYVSNNTVRITSIGKASTNVRFKAITF